MAMTKKERDFNKALIAIHKGFTETIADLKKEDFTNYSIMINNSARLTNDMVDDYLRLYGVYEASFEGKEKPSAIDRAMVFGSVLHKKSTISAAEKTDGKKLIKRTEDLNEKFITETMLAMINYSSYAVLKGKKIDYKKDFSLDSFDVGHKKELNSLKQLIINALKDEEYDFLEIKNLLRYIYLKGIMYENGIELDDVLELAKNIKIYEKREKAVEFKYKDTTAYDEIKRAYRR